MSFLRQNRNKTCPELTKSRSHKKISGEHACFRTLFAIMGARRNFRGGGASPKKGPHHEVKSSKKAPKNEKNVAKRPPYEEKRSKKAPNIAKKTYFLFSRGGGGDGLLLPPPPLRASMLVIAWL